MPSPLKTKYIWCFICFTISYVNATRDYFSLYLAESIPKYPVGTSILALSIQDQSIETFGIFLNRNSDRYDSPSRFFLDEDGSLGLLPDLSKPSILARTVLSNSVDVSDAMEMWPLIFTTSESFSSHSQIQSDSPKFLLRFDGVLEPISNRYAQKPAIYVCHNETTHTRQLAVAAIPVASEACTAILLTTNSGRKHYLRADEYNSLGRSASYTNTSIPNDLSYFPSPTSRGTETVLKGVSIPSVSSVLITITVIISVSYQVIVDKNAELTSLVIESASTTLTIARGATMIVSTSTLHVATEIDEDDSRCTTMFSLSEGFEAQYTGLPIISVISPGSTIAQQYNLAPSLTKVESFQLHTITMIQSVSTAITQEVTYRCDSYVTTQEITSDYTATFTGMAAFAILSNIEGLTASLVGSVVPKATTMRALGAVSQVVQSTGDIATQRVVPGLDRQTQTPSQTLNVTYTNQVNDHYSNSSDKKANNAPITSLGSPSSSFLYSTTSVMSNDKSFTTVLDDNMNTSTTNTNPGIFSATAITMISSASQPATNVYSTSTTMPSNESRSAMSTAILSSATTSSAHDSIDTSTYRPIAIGGSSSSMLGAVGSGLTQSIDIASTTSSSPVASNTVDLNELKSIMVRTYYNQIQRWNAYGCAVSPSLLLQCTDISAADIPTVDVFDHNGGIVLSSLYPNGTYTTDDPTFNGIDLTTWTTVSADFANSAINILFTSCLSNITCTEAYQAAGNDAPRAVEEVVMKNINYTTNQLTASPDGTWIPNSGLASFVSRWHNYPSNTTEVYGVHSILKNSIENDVFDLATVNLVLDARYATGYGVQIIEVIYNTLILGQYFNDEYYVIEKRDTADTVISSVASATKPQIMSIKDPAAKVRLLQEVALWKGTERAKIYDILAMDPVLHASLSPAVSHHRRAECLGTTASEDAIKYFESTEELCKDVEVVESIFSAFGLGLNIGTALTVPRPAQITNLLKGIDEAMLDGIAKICAASKARIVCPGGNDAWVLANDLYGGVTTITEILEITEKLVELDSPLVLADLAFKGLSLYCNFADAGKIAYTAGKAACVANCASQACLLAGGYCANYAGPGP